MERDVVPATVEEYIKSRQNKKNAFKTFTASALLLTQSNHPDHADAPSESEPAPETLSLDKLRVVAASTLAAGEWTEDARGSRAQTGDDDGARQRLTAGAVVSDLEAAEQKDSRTQDIKNSQDEARKQFHIARQQAKDAQDKQQQPSAAAPAAAVEASRVWRPRVVANNRSGAGFGVSVLRELDNEQVFPSLGGNRRSAAPAVVGGAWNVVDQDMVRQAADEKKAAAAKYSDFVASEKFAGSRPGFEFRAGPQGVGYYGHAADTSKDAAAPAAPPAAPATAAAAPAWGAAAAARAAAAPAPADDGLRRSENAWKPKSRQ